MSKEKQIVVAVVLFCLLLGAGIFAVFKPKVVHDRTRQGIFLKNEGRLSALIYRADGFWFQGGKVSMLDNLPGIRQTLGAYTGWKRLQMPEIPSPGPYGVQEEDCYMKIALRYGIPGVPIFRFSTLLYFRYDDSSKSWKVVDHIPPKDRALGRIPIGDVGRIELSFE